MAGYRRLWTIIAGLALGTGLAVALLSVPRLTVIGFAVSTGIVCTLGHLSWRATRPDHANQGLWRSTGVAALLGAASGAAATGLVALLDAPAVLLVLAVVVTAPPVVGKVARRLRRARTLLAGPSDPVGPPDPSGPSARPARSAPRSGSTAIPVTTRSMVRRMSTAELCRAWRTSFTALQRLTVAVELTGQAQLVQSRQHYLDELERRDPAGFRRWLYGGARPASDPSRYLTSTPSSTSASGPAADQDPPQPTT